MTFVALEIALQINLRSTMSAIEKLQVRGVELDPNDLQSIKSAMKRYKSDKAIFALIAEAKKEKTREARGGIATATKEVKRREQLTTTDKEIEDIIGNWSSNEGMQTNRPNL